MRGTTTHLSMGSEVNRGLVDGNVCFGGHCTTAYNAASRSSAASCRCLSPLPAYSIAACGGTGGCAASAGTHARSHGTGYHALAHRCSAFSPVRSALGLARSSDKKWSHWPLLWLPGSYHSHTSGLAECCAPTAHPMAPPHLRAAACCMRLFCALRVHLAG